MFIDGGTFILLDGRALLLIDRVALLAGHGVALLVVLGVANLVTFWFVEALTSVGLGADQLAVFRWGSEREGNASG